MTDFTIHTVVWKVGRSSEDHILDFDDESEALRAMLIVESQPGAHDIQMSTCLLDADPIPESVKERVWQALLGKLREDNARKTLALRGAEAALAEAERLLADARDIWGIREAAV